MKVKKRYIIDFETETKNNFMVELFENMLHAVTAVFNGKYKKTNIWWEEVKV